MSRGKRGTCNYKMMTFRISLKNWKYLHNGINTSETPGQYINRILEEDKKRNNYNEQEEIDKRQTTLKFNEN